MIRKNMFLGAKPSTFKNADHLRRNPTEAEALLWEHLRERKMEGIKFRRQHALLGYVADFYAHELKLIIEVDGDYHQEGFQREYDLDRETNLKLAKCHILRFKNEEVIYAINYVLEKIKSKILELKSLKKKRKHT